MNISVRDAVESIRHQLKGLSKRDTAIAISRAMNRAIITAQSETRKEIRSVYNIPAAQVRKQTTVKRANVNKLEASVQASSAFTPLHAFNPVEIKRTGVKTKRTGGRYSSVKLKRVRSGSTGVTIEIKKGQRKRLPSAFLVQSGSAMVVMARGQYNGRDFTWRKKRIKTSGNDTPIDAMNTVSVYKAAITGQVQQRVNEATQRTFTNRLLHEISQGVRYGSR